jgi:hypothetical protein
VIQSDDRVEVTPMLRNLDHRFRWFGVQLEDTPIAVVPMLLVFGLSIPFGYSPGWALLTAMALFAALILLKWGKPEGYLQTQLTLHFAPRRLSHKVRDLELDPFPLDAALASRVSRRTPAHGKHP